MSKKKQRKKAVTIIEPAVLLKKLGEFVRDKVCTEFPELGIKIDFDFKELPNGSWILRVYEIPTFDPKTGWGASGFPVAVNKLTRVLSAPRYGKQRKPYVHLSGDAPWQERDGRQYLVVSGCYKSLYVGIDIYLSPPLDVYPEEAVVKSSGAIVEQTQERNGV